MGVGAELFFTKQFFKTWFTYFGVSGGARVGVQVQLWLMSGVAGAQGTVLSIPVMPAAATTTLFPGFAGE